MTRGPQSLAATPQRRSSRGEYRESVTAAQGSRSFPAPHPFDLRLTVSPLRHGSGDPTIRLGAHAMIRAARTPDGPATLHLRLEGSMISAEAWGAGREWALETAPELLGSDDDPSALQARHPVVEQLGRRLAGLRMPRSSGVWEAVLPAILEQKVTGREARSSFRRVVRAFGEPAPGPFGERGRGTRSAMPFGVRLPPSPERIATTPAYAFHRFGVESRRAEVIRAVARVGARLNASARDEPETTRNRMRTIPGIGPWTEAEVARVAFGDADAVSVGDFHVPSAVAWALAGEPRAGDARMLELLEPYHGQRGRVQLLIEIGGPPVPRHGPRMAVRSIEAL
jgi:3-methyladenine DNA glycosylase/8-oxoguanine DNA glycosylase